MYIQYMLTQHGRPARSATSKHNKKERHTPAVARLAAIALRRSGLSG